MLLRRLQLTNFRTYAGLDLSLPAGRLLFLGDNAQGKSNLLEAVYLLASGRSARASNDSELIGWQGEGIDAALDPARPEALDQGGTQPFTRLQGSVERHNGNIQLETLIVGAPGSSAVSPRGGDLEGGIVSQPGNGRGGKRFRVNGIPRRAIDFVGQLRAVLFTADDLEIISGAPSGRRQYLDAALSQLDRGYYAALQRYGRITQQRNASLRRIREGIAGNDELMLWEDSFTREGATIIAARRNAVARLASLAAVAHDELSGAREALDLTYEPQLGGEWSPLLPEQATAVGVQPLFAAALAAQRRREIAAGVSLLGPHRDDMSVRLNGVEAAAFGSRAQVRTASLAMRLAEARLLMEDSADPPVLLLDDIVSELDERRRQTVLAGVSGFDQVLFTATTGVSLPPDFLASAHTFDVRSGQISAI